MNKLHSVFITLVLVTLFGCDTLFINFVPSTEDPPPEHSENVFYVLTLDTFGEGQVLVDQAGISFKYNTKLLLSAVPDEGWVFDHWEGDVESDDPEITITMSRDKHVTAVFVEIVPDLIVLDVLPDGHGEVIITPQGVEAENGILFPIGTTVTLEADPDPGWVFLGYFTEDGILLSEDEVTDFVLNTDTFIIAQFGEVIILPP